MTEKMFRVGHFCLHVKSLRRLERFARTFERIVVWLPIFTEPSTADVYYRLAITLSPKMERIWRHLQQQEAGPPKFLRSDLYSSSLKGFTRKASGKEIVICEEISPSQWPSTENNLPFLIHKTFPQFPEWPRIEFGKYVVNPSDEEEFTEPFDWTFDIIKVSSTEPLFYE